MPTYNWYCPNCNSKFENKLSFKEHEELKNKLECSDCHAILVQQVASLNFRLAGNGWFGNSDTCVDPYGITDMETRNNLEHEKRVEDYAMAMSGKENNIKEL